MVALSENASIQQADSLHKELRTAISGEVRFDDGSRALYATDGSNYRQPPIGVVIPTSKEDVIRTVAICRKHGAPILGRGCGTSLAGQCCNVAVVIDMSKYMNRILDLDPEAKTARVQPGVILDNLRNAAEQHHLTFAPDPATHTHNTLGGMIGNNSCGIHSVMGGRTADNIIELEILTYDGAVMRVGAANNEELANIIARRDRRGEIYGRLKSLRDRYADEIRRRFPDIPRRVSGYNLDELLPERGFNVARALVGTESTCALVLEATVQLVYSPPVRALLVLGYRDVYRAGDHIAQIMSLNPIGCEGIDDRLVKDMLAVGLNEENEKLLPKGHGWLLVEIGAEDMEGVMAQGREMMESIQRSGDPPNMAFYPEPEQQQKVWEIRESGLGATAHVPSQGLTWPGWEDSAVPPARVGEYLRELRKLLDAYEYGCDLYGHFGQGCIHVRIDFDLSSDEGIEKYRRFAHRAAELVVRFGGSLSGEHGDGQARGSLLPIMYGDELMQAFREFKSIWDPEGKMNPGKVIDAYPLDANLRLKQARPQPQPITIFKYPEDNGDFQQALLRCVGVGKCRRESGGTMCPSFMATHEEMHTTRGRAHLLFEMLQGDVITGGWKEPAVKEALDLCLACKGCKSDCPVHVDMATYKAEFLAHFYEDSLRPRSAYAFGLIDRWARLGSIAPRLVNFLTQTPGFRDIAKSLVGMAPQRAIPRFSAQTFQSWFRNRPVVNAYAPRVLLWPDTFNNYFQPEVLKAAVNVLENGGYQVIVPGKPICCGRPLYDWGMLDRAQTYLRRVMNRLNKEIEAGLPIIGLEPACVTVFKDELVHLFPEDRIARRLHEQSCLLSEFMVNKAPSFDLPKLDRRAIVQGHCHHKAIMKMADERTVLDKLGLDFEILDSGCCGMAGAFGLEAHKYDISVKCAERVLLPEVRKAERGTLIVADGFSCREQIMDLAGVKALHLAEVVWLAIRESRAGKEEKRGVLYESEMYLRP